MHFAAFRASLTLVLGPVVAPTGAHWLHQRPTFFSQVIFPPHCYTWQKCKLLWMLVYNYFYKHAQGRTESAEGSLFQGKNIKNLISVSLIDKVQNRMHIAFQHMYGVRNVLPHLKCDM